MEKTKLGLQEFLDYLNTQVKNGSIYLWGGQGETLEMLTDSYIRKKEPRNMLQFPIQANTN